MPQRHSAAQFLLQSFDVGVESSAHARPAELPSRAEYRLIGAERQEQTAVHPLGVVPGLDGFHDADHLKVIAADLNVLADRIWIIAEQNVAHALPDHRDLAPLLHVGLVDEAAEI